MGYDVHITRRAQWQDDRGPAITVEHWRALVAADPELQFDGDLGEDVATWRGGPAPGWIAWRAGNLETKNPDIALLRKMAAIAAVLDAQVQGDDGERYDAAGNAQPAPRPRRPGLVARLWSWWRAQRTRVITLAPLPFAVGDRVRDTFGNVGTVVRIDLRAHSGLGDVAVRYDDGRVVHNAAIAHGLEPADAATAPGTGAS
jgi:hypothetical protein